MLLRENGGASKVPWMWREESARGMGVIYMGRTRVSKPPGMRQAHALRMEVVHSKRWLLEGELYKLSIVCC